MVTDLSTIRICTPLCTVKSLPDSDAEASSEMLFGESVEVLEQEEQWSKIRSKTDGYEGYIPSSACQSIRHEVTHWVSTRATFVFERADIKSPVVSRLLFGSQLPLSAVDTNEKFLYLNDIGYVWAGHCRQSDDFLNVSLINIAEQHYLDAPYLWGGRSSDGCDCSGLVQLLAAAKGIKVPRDSGDQEQALFVDVDYNDRAADDLVYWPGHVSILKTIDDVLHSTAHTLRCCVEPLEAVIDRAGPPSSIKRLV